MGAIKKNSEGIAEIDFDKCIFCGKCFSNCPFSAIMERSELMNVLNEIKKGKEVVAMIAPSAQNQFPGTVGQLFSAVAKMVSRM
ncbi:MAG: 4Fe-4S binding protein [Victivallales bacterium]